MLTVKGYLTAQYLCSRKKTNKQIFYVLHTALNENDRDAAGSLMCVGIGIVTRVPLFNYSYHIPGRI